MGLSVEIREKYKLFCDLERPPLYRQLARRGEGFLRVRCGRHSYLVRHTEGGMPELVGRMVEKFRKVGDRYVAAYIPAEYFSVRERAALEGILE